MTDEYMEALAHAASAAVKLGTALAMFENAIHELRDATPHCDACRWATGRGHHPRCNRECLLCGSQVTGHVCPVRPGSPP